MKNNSPLLHGACSGKNLFQHFAGLDTGELEVQSCGPEGQLFMINSQTMQDCRLQIRDMDFIFHDVETHLISRTHS